MKMGEKFLYQFSRLINAETIRSAQFELESYY